MLKSNVEDITNICLEEAHIQRQAAECIIKIEASGGVCCSKEGIYRVLEAMRNALDSTPVFTLLIALLISSIGCGNIDEVHYKSDNSVAILTDDSAFTGTIYQEDEQHFYVSVPYEALPLEKTEDYDKELVIYRDKVAYKGKVWGLSDGSWVYIRADKHAF